MGRREEIADAGVRLIARDGVRALTHLLADKEAGIPPGSTSYYARTRRELTALVVERLSARTRGDLDELTIPARVTLDEAAEIAATFLDCVAHREDAQAARFALLFELRKDEELRSRLTIDAPVRKALIDKAEALLLAVDVADPARHAADLVALVDALVMYRSARAGPVDAAGVLRAYLDGLQPGDRT